MNNSRPVSRRTALGAFGALVAAGTVAAASPALAATPRGPLAVAHRAPAPRFGASPFLSVSVDKNLNGTWTVSYVAPGTHAVKVFVGADAVRFGAKPVVGRGGSASVVVRANAARPWVKLVADGGAPLVAASRHLDFAGILNARDIGGYRTSDGRWVRSGLVYRTAALTPAASDLALLNNLGIASDNDLRTTAEAMATPDTVPAHAVYHQFNVVGDDTAATIPSVADAAAAEAYVAQAELSFVDAATAKAAFKELLETIANDRGASLYHCTAGKDRTGWASAVLLTLLGVDRETVMSDYLLSNRYYLESAAIQSQLAAMPADQAAIYEKFFAVEAQYLQTGLDRVQAEYGTVERYVTNGLGVSPVTVAQLRAKLLDGAPTHR